MGAKAACVAQTPAARSAAPRIGYVYPAGAQQGTTVMVTVGGISLDDVEAVEVSGGGVGARVVGRQRPLGQKEIEPLKAEAEALREKRRLSREAVANGGARTWTPADEARGEELRALLAYRPNRQSAPAIAETVTVELTVAAPATPGVREIRLRGPRGLSNPMIFVVGTLPEFSEPAAPANTALGEKREKYGAPKAKPAPVERSVTLPAVVNGQILPGEVDRVRFQAKKGQRLVLAVQARALIPYLADAVPGWFQATLGLFDASGRELAYDDDFRFSPDPVLFHEVREDGEYVLEIKDAIFRGRQDFVYRIAVGELPFVTSLFPLGGVAGKTTEVALTGWNLPSSRLAVDGNGVAGGTLQVAVQRGAELSNQMPFAIDAAPACGEAGGDNSPEHPQVVTLPMVVDGRIGRPGDVDAVSFEARAGETVVCEVLARRLNSPLDSLLRLLGPDGTELARNDDYEDRAAGLTTHQADSRLQFQLPAAGRYTVLLGDTQQQGGPEFAYRLQVRPPQPDFALRVVPASINLRPGTHVPVTVFALRRDGFTGAIELGLRDGHGVFGVAGGEIPEGQDKVRLTLTTRAAPRAEPYAVEFAGAATIAGKRTAHLAVPCEDLMQAFAYRHLVPAESQQVAIIGKPVGPRAAIRVESVLPLMLTPGRTQRLDVTVPQRRYFDDVQAELSEPPPGVALVSSRLIGIDGVELVLEVDAKQAVAGSRGNLIVLLTGQRPAKRADDPKKVEKRPRRFPLTALPAISYEIGGAAP